MILTTYYYLYNPTIGYKICRGPVCFDIIIYKRSRRMVIKSCFANVLSIISHTHVIVVCPNIKLIHVKELIHVYTRQSEYYICARIIDDLNTEFTLLDFIVILRKLVARYYAIGANGQLYVIPKK